MSIAVLFPGQGSQYLGMGQDFIENSPACRNIMATAEEVCEAPIGSLCQDGPMEDLTKAEHLQPAITAVNLMCWQALKEKIAPERISCFAGHSLGEYSALHGAGVIGMEDTLRLVAKRGQLMGREGEKNPGGMRAVLGLGIEDVEQAIASCNGAGNITAANHNTAEQIVLSGDMEGLDQVSEKLQADGAKIIPLNVSVANHSPLVADAVPDFAEFMETISFSTPNAPVLFNVTAAEENDVNTIKEIMARQIASRVRWYEIITKMVNNGVDTFIEVGPKTVLKGMMRKIVPKGVKVTSLQFDSPEGLEKCLAKIV